MDFRNKDFRILGLRGFIYKPPRSPKPPKKCKHADCADIALETRI